MQLKPTDAYKIVLTQVVGFLLVYAFTNKAIWLNISLGIALLSLCSKPLAYWLSFVWMKLAWVLSLIMPNIIFGLFYFIFLTPIALLAKLAGKKSGLVLKNPTTTNFVSVNKEFHPNSFEKMW